MIDKDYGAKVPILNSVSDRKCVEGDPLLLMMLTLPRVQLVQPLGAGAWGEAAGPRRSGHRVGASLTALALAWWGSKRVRRRMRGHRGSGTQV